MAAKGNGLRTRSAIVAWYRDIEDVATDLYQLSDGDGPGVEAVPVSVGDGDVKALNEGSSFSIGGGPMRVTLAELAKS